MALEIKRLIERLINDKRRSINLVMRSVTSTDAWYVVMSKASSVQCSVQFDTILKQGSRSEQLCQRMMKQLISRLKYNKKERNYGG